MQRISVQYIWEEEIPSQFCIKCSKIYLFSMSSLFDLKIPSGFLLGRLLRTRYYSYSVVESTTY